MTQPTGTKELIFDIFVGLTSSLGYENVSVRDIAEQVGINPASIYYHFAHKSHILEYAYDYYREHQYDNRTPVDEMKALMETASAEEIVRAMTSTFESEDKKKYIWMVLITKIVYMRLYQDPIANEIFAEANANNTEYAESILKHGIECGRIDPSFDIEAFVRILIGSMQIMGVKSFSDPSYSVRQLDEENGNLALISSILQAAMK